MTILEDKKTEMNFKNRKYILFDLDGTLTQSHEGIINAIKYSLERLNISFYYKGGEFFRELIGPPLEYSYKIKFGLSEDKANLAKKYFREYYNERGYIENRLYDGVYNMLKTLVAVDRRIVLASSKSMDQAIKILKHFDIDDFFYFVGAADEGHNRSEKSEVIKYILDNCKDINTENCVMIGDRVFDVEGSAAFGIDCIAVGYGYADRKELNDAEPALIVDTVSDLKDVLI